MKILVLYLFIQLMIKIHLKIKKLIEKKNKKIKEHNLFLFNILLIENINDKNTERKVEFE